jgi:light-regulated signal transduction histidine kinase (bacteriophytochrome)
MADVNTLQQLLQGCEAEQLHLSGAIQSFGAMVRLQTDSLRVTHASANLKQFVGVEPGEVLGRNSADLPWLPAPQIITLGPAAGQTLSVRGVVQDALGRIDALLIRGEDSILVEFERNNAPVEPIALQHLQQTFMSAPHSTQDMAHYHQALVLAFHRIIGFDRVMLYRFAPDWSGEVIAESTATGVGSYHGLRFPASDIPAIARNLYLVNPARMIPDALAKPVPLLGLDASVPDLTRSDLRSVSPVHLEYLANMGVGASFSVPVRMTGQLWGLVACHNEVAHLLTPDQRNACVTLANTYALGLSSYIAGQRLKKIDSLERRIDSVLEKLASHSDPLDGIESHTQALMETLDAHGFAVAIKDNVVMDGDGPDLDGLAIIDDWFVNHAKEFILCSDHLVEVFPDNLLVLGAASGMIAIKVKTPRSGWVRFYWFRQAEPQQVAWAGNPNKPIVENAGAIALSPRRSFERWVENKSDYSRAWSKEEQMVAAKFRSNLMRWL